MSKITYRELKKYKYQLLEDIEVYLPEITSLTSCEKINGYIYLYNGIMTVKSGYAWDGASGPTIDTKNSMRASLVHDCFWQLVRENKLPSDYLHVSNKVFHRHLLEDGMSKFRARYWYWAVSLYASIVTVLKNIKSTIEYFLIELAN